MRLSLHGMLFACSLCGKPFFNSHVLKSHHRLMHRRTLSKSELHGNLQDGLSKEVTATFNGSLDKSLDMGEVESNIDRGSSDIHQTPSLATAQMRAIDNRAIQKRIETTIELDTDIDEVSYPNSRNEGETSSSGEGQNITEKGKEHFTSPQCSRPLASEKKLVQMHTNSNNCEGGNLPLNEKISVDGGTRKNASSLQSDSTQERPEFSCKECGIFLSNIQTYKKHNMAYHRDQAFKCNVCGSLYVQQSDLDSHMIVHTADRPYSCFICKKAFRQIRTLRLHLRCHEGKAKFPCEICDKIFDSIVALRQHLFSHTGKEVQP
ncbi:zinc finger protein OZF [Anabrus simplex]|uniref:zinc finger protein OZF n=1 Tax=Anabrus simplex TaxID=316456 RepID=UPI0035A3323A